MKEEQLLKWRAAYLVALFALIAIGINYLLLALLGDYELGYIYSFGSIFPLYFIVVSFGVGYYQGSPLLRLAMERASKHPNWLSFWYGVRIVLWVIVISAVGISLFMFLFSLPGVWSFSFKPIILLFSSLLFVLLELAIIFFASFAGILAVLSGGFSGIILYRLARKYYQSARKADDIK